MKFFQNCTTPEEIKSLYRVLAMEHHPDMGGDTRTMQDLNSEYMDALRRFDGYTATGTDGKEHTYYYNEVKEQTIIDKVDELIKLNLPEDVEIWIIGIWIWAKGNTKPVKDQIKSVDGMRWHSKRVCWYWRNPGSKTFYSGASFNSLANAYGAKFIDRDQKEEKASKKALKA